MKNLIARFVREDAGQDLVEYAILIGLVTVGVVTFAQTIGKWTGGQFKALATDLQGKGAAPLP